MRQPEPPGHSPLGLTWSRGTAPNGSARSVAAGDRRAAARTHPDRLGRAAGAAPDPAEGTAVHAGADEDRGTVRMREGREATGRFRPGVADVGMG